MLILYLSYYLRSQKTFLELPYIYIERERGERGEKRELQYPGPLSRIAGSDIQIVNVFWPIKLTKLSCIEYPLLKRWKYT